MVLHFWVVYKNHWMHLGGRAGMPKKQMVEK